MTPRTYQTREVTPFTRRIVMIARHLEKKNIQLLGSIRGITENILPSKKLNYIKDKSKCNICSPSNNPHHEKIYLGFGCRLLTNGAVAFSTIQLATPHGRCANSTICQLVKLPMCHFFNLLTCRFVKLPIYQYVNVSIYLIPRSVLCFCMQNGKAAFPRACDNHSPILRDHVTANVL